MLKEPLSWKNIRNQYTKTRNEYWTWYSNRTHAKKALDAPGCGVKWWNYVSKGNSLSLVLRTWKNRVPKELICQGVPTYDQYSWWYFANNLSKIKSWENAKILLQLNTLPKLIKIVTFNRAPQETPSSSWELFVNERLTTTKWRIYHKTEVGPKGQTLILDINEKSMEALKTLMFSLYTT